MATSAAPTAPSAPTAGTGAPATDSQPVQATPVYVAEPVPGWQSRSYNTVLLTAPYRGPANPSLAGVDSLTPRQDHLLKVYGTSRIVRLFAIIDIIFTIIYGVFIPVQLLFLLFPILGLCATQRFSAWMAFTYSFFILLQVVGRVVFLAFFYQFGFIFFTLIAIVVELLIFFFVFRFAVQCTDLSPDDRYFLKESEIINSIKRRSWC